MDPRILEDGCLVTFRMYLWNASIKIDPTVLKKDAPKEILRTMQDIIVDKSTLKEMVQIKNRIYYHLNQPEVCIPFPIENVYCPLLERIPELDEMFQECDSLYWDLARKVLRELPSKRNEFKSRYPKYYKLIQHRYPTVQRLERKFYFHYNFFQMAMPDKKLKILSPKVYKREKEKQLNIVKEMESLTISIVGSMLLERVKKLEEQCREDTIHGKTVKGVENFLSNWEKIWDGYIDEAKMKSIVNTLRIQMKRVNAEKLKDSEELREKLAKRLSSTINKIEAIPNIELKRKLNL